MPNQTKLQRLEDGRGGKNEFPETEENEKTAAEFLTRRRIHERSSDDESLDTEPYVWKMRTTGFRQQSREAVHMWHTAAARNF